MRKSSVDSVARSDGNPKCAAPGTESSEGAANKERDISSDHVGHYINAKWVAQ